jgi:uncharacterized RDD family membrane protein YckC
METKNYQPCSLLRRFAAIFYDCLVLSAVLLFCTLIMIPFTHGNAIASGNIAYKIYLFCICYLYFSWQWMHGGQTLGMRVWNIRLQKVAPGVITWKIASLRFLSAIFSLVPIGAGFFWSLIDHKNLAFHDHFSGSYPANVHI